MTVANCAAVSAPPGATAKQVKMTERPSPARVSAPCVLVDGTSVHAPAGSVSVCSSVPAAPVVGIAYSSRYTCSTVVAVLAVAPAPMRSTTTEPNVSARLIGVVVCVGVVVGECVTAAVRVGVGVLDGVRVGDGDGVPDVDGVSVCVPDCVSLVDGVTVPVGVPVAVDDPELDAVPEGEPVGVAPLDLVTDGDGVTDGVPAGVAELDGVTDGDGVPEPVSDGDGVAVREEDGDGVGDLDAVIVCEGVGDVMDAMIPR